MKRSRSLNLGLKSRVHQLAPRENVSKDRNLKMKFTSVLDRVHCASNIVINHCIVNNRVSKRTCLNLVWGCLILLPAIWLTSVFMCVLQHVNVSHKIFHGSLRPRTCHILLISIIRKIVVSTNIRVRGQTSLVQSAPERLQSSWICALI